MKVLETLFKCEVRVEIGPDLCSRLELLSQEMCVDTGLSYKAKFLEEVTVK